MIDDHANVWHTTTLSEMTPEPNLLFIVPTCRLPWVEKRSHTAWAPRGDLIEMPHAPSTVIDLFVLSSADLVASSLLKSGWLKDVDASWVTLVLSDS